MIKMLVCILLLLLAAAAAAVIYLGTTAAGPGDTCVATVGKVRRSLYGAGRVEGLPETTLRFPFPGYLDKVPVKEGQEVVLNDTLAEMNPSEVEKQVKQAEAALEEAQAELDLAKAPPAAEVVHKAEEKYEQAKGAVKVAELKLEVLEHPPAPLPAKDWELAEAERTIKDAQSQLDLAQIELKKLKEGPNPDDVEVAKRKYEAAGGERDIAKKSLDSFKTGTSVPPIFPFTSAGPKPTKADLEAALARAEQAVEVANAEYDKVKRGPKPDDIKVQELKVEMAKNAVEGATAKKARLEKPDPPAPAPANEVKQARLALEQAQDGEKFAKTALEDAKRGSDPNKIRAAEAARKRREAELSTLKLRKEALTLRAPFDGQVTKKFEEAGATVEAFRPIISLADFSHKRVRAEYDVGRMPDLKAGAPVIVSSRAFNKETLEGKVQELGRIGARRVTVDDPAAPRGGEIVEVLIAIEEPKSESKKKLYNEVLKIGLPVDTEVVLEERQNVLVVPRSYVAQENGKEYVLILERDKISGKTEAPRQRFVKCGLRDEHFVEIIEGLNDGDTIMKPKASNER